MPLVLDSLNNALHHSLAADPRVYLLGEDMLDPYGGAFKVSRGLSIAFPGRVFTTPISEAGITGVAVGMALRGLRPVVEIMFGDFVTLIADQLINHLTKFPWMYSGGKRDQDAVRVPLVIRTPMGGRRGYGPTHSQTLEKMFLGVPGLRILAPSALGDPGGLLSTAILEDDQPVLFIENKLLYLLPVQDPLNLEEFEPNTEPLSAPQTPLFSHGVKDREKPDFYAPTYSLSVHGAPSSDLTLVAYGHMAELARQAVLQMAYDHEIFIDLVIPTQLAPFNVEPILNSVRRTGRLLVAEEGTLNSGWGAEVLAQAIEAVGPRLQIARRVAAKNFPIPASGSLEAAVLPGVDEIMRIARKMI